VSDTYDGMNPSDNPQGATAIPPRPRDPSEDYDLMGTIVQPLPTDNLAYAILSVYGSGVEPGLSDCDSHADATRKLEKWNAEHPYVNHYIVAVPVPAYIKPKK